MSQFEEDFMNGNNRGNEETDAVPFRPSGLGVTAKAPCYKDDGNYKMDHLKRGHTFFFSNVKPYVKKTADDDFFNLHGLCKKLGFQTHYYEEKTFAEIKSVISKFGEENHDDEDCVVLIFVTHGKGPNQILNGDKYHNLQKELFSLLSPKKCKSLAGKPKIIFIQSYEEQIDPSSDQKGSETDKNIEGYKIPTHCDFFMVHNSSPANTENGAPFYKCLSEELLANPGAHDLSTFVAMVAHNVAEVTDTVPTRISTLIREIVITPKFS